MRKILSLFAFVAIVISFVACGGNVPGGEEPEVPHFQFKVQILSTKAHVIVTPDTPNKAYFWWREKASTIDAKQMTLQEYVEDYLSNKTYDEWYGSFILTKPDDFTMKSLDADSKYIIYAFYVEKVGEDAKIVGNIESYEFTTLPEYTLNGEFSISDTKKVRFMSANMKKESASSGLSFMSNQWEYKNSNSAYPRDLFQWEEAMNGFPSLVPYRILSASEWEYLFITRPDAKKLFAHATILVNNVEKHGLILLPDNWVTPDGIQLKTDHILGFEWNQKDECYQSVDYNLNGYEKNVYTTDQWQTLEFAGAVFLPAPGYVSEDGTQQYLFMAGLYWSSTTGNDKAHYMVCRKNTIIPHYTYSTTPYISVRPVSDIK